MAVPTTFDQCRLLTDADGEPEKLGAGWLGVTYKGFDSRLRVPVALRVITPARVAQPEDRQRLADAVTRASRLRHRHIAATYRFGEQDEHCYYTMEFVDGESLATLLDREGPLPYARALEIIGQAASALQAAQPHQVVHGGLKPSNLMLLSDDDAMVVKVLDFGLAHHLAAGGTGDADQTRVEAGYCLSPEQLDRGEVDVRTDIYALGLVLWRMLAGEPPYTLSAGATSAAIPDELPWDKLADQPEAVTLLLLQRMLEKDPARRFATPSDLQAAIKRTRQVIESPAGETIVPPSEKLASTRPPASRTPVSTRVAPPPSHPPRMAPPPITEIRPAPEPEPEPETEPAPAAFHEPPPPTPTPVPAPLVPVPRPIPVLPESPMPTARDADTGAPVEMVRTRAVDMVRSRDDEPAAQIVDLVPEPASEEGTIILQQAEPLVEHPPKGQGKGLRMAIIGTIAAALIAGGFGLYLHFRSPSSSNGKNGTPVSIEEASRQAAGLEEQQRWGEALTAWAAIVRGNPDYEPGKNGLNQTLDQVIRRLGTFSPTELEALNTPLDATIVQGSPKAKMLSETLAAFIEAHRFETLRKWQNAYATRTALAAKFSDLDFDLADRERFLERMSTRFSEVSPADYEAMRGDLEKEALRGSAGAARVLRAHLMVEVKAAEELERSQNWPAALNAWLRLAKKSPDALPPLKLCLDSLSRLSPGLSPEEFTQMRDDITEAANMGVRSAQLILGYQLRRIDPIASFAWYCESAKNGEPLAMERAGQALLAGIGTPRDPVRAVAYLNEAAEKENVRAMVALAQCYFEGIGTPVDQKRAATLLRRAVDLGDRDAMTKLAGAYDNGWGVEQDDYEAYGLFAEADKLGDAVATFNLGILLSRDERQIIGKRGSKHAFKPDADLARTKFEQAYEKFQEDTDKGNGGSNPMYFRAFCLENGFGVTQDMEAATEWYRKAAAAGHPKAQKWCKDRRLPF